MLFGLIVGFAIGWLARSDWDTDLFKDFHEKINKYLND